MVEKKPNLTIEFQDYLALKKVLFDWADSYDAKDWDRLRSIIAPTLTVDYTQIGLRKWSDMSAEDYMAMITDIDFLGDPTIKTQHLLGESWWEKISDTEVIGHHQLRAAHQVYTDSSLQTVKLKGHGHATNEHYYRKIDGVWKFAGLKPTVRWNEYQFEDVFRATK
ncbi:probable scytalone dehydratase [Aspergillus udagawae]|uniref:Probable scytalone dehydratase n=1 Tax=Aspergillus udagawae TaxID=91492 RepID=A0A8H3P0A1_9EURO|nr:probable scytalone dehydratase [Aspergillus udagawae]GFF44366.1 probable scytalone dehydratase [Aspergillus udagawae]GFF94138.1 probable scytalone dehydratase [Aspergillus udagawae]GFG09735.1 probable scytalone dehydratase [Aspergillus udagawae]GFG23948.1 probable scytalone dehydratase [Aspergillus udagawae]